MTIIRETEKEFTIRYNLCYIRLIIGLTLLISLGLDMKLGLYGIIGLCVVCFLCESICFTRKVSVEVLFDGIVEIKVTNLDQTTLKTLSLFEIDSIWISRHLINWVDIPVILTPIPGY